MSHKKQFSWMVRPRGFIKLLGAEYELMKRAGGRVLLKFYSASLIIFFIAIITFLSVRYAVELMFHLRIVEISLSLFLSLLFVLMYIFLINTFTKDVKQKSLFNLSNATRMGFVIFMGFILSKPVEVFFLKDHLEKDIYLYQQKLIEEHNQKIAELFAGDVLKLQNEMNHYVSMGGENLFRENIDALSLRIDVLKKKSERLINASESKISKADFFIYRIQTASTHYFSSWMICLMVIVLFLLPGYLIYSISAQDEYFKIKAEQEKRIIGNAYQAFLEKYHSYFRKYQIDIQFYTKYSDPPFNTKLKEEPIFNTSDDFHLRYAVK